jgi:hypothetical protein
MWLAWVFCIDSEQNFILASNASSRLPSHLTKEGGFGENGGEASDSARATGGATGGGRVTTNKKIAAAIKNQEATAAFINSAIGEVKLISSQHANPTATPEVVTYNYCQSRAKQYKTPHQDFDDDGNLSPESKDAQVSIAKSMQKRWLKRALFTAEHGPSKKQDFEEAEKKETERDDESE